MKKISIVSPCYNEEKNLHQLYKEVRAQFQESLTNYEYEHIFIDNCSTDQTPEILRELAAQDQNVKVIFNSKNFGHIRSPVHALFQAQGDAIIMLVSDLQDPPHLIPEFVKKWEEGNQIVVGVKKESGEIQIPIPLTHNDVAHIVGVARETVSIELKKFFDKGIINHTGKFILIKNKNKLAKEASRL